MMARGERALRPPSGVKIAEPGAESTIGGWSLRWILGVAFATLAVMASLNLAASVLYHGRDDELTRQVASLFLFDRERSLATFFNFSLIVVDFVLLGIMTLLAWRCGSRWRWHWLLLAAGFLLLAYDEAASLHERLNRIAEGIVGSAGVLYFPWIVFGGAIFAAVGIVYLRFVLALPRPVMWLVFAAAGLYGAGAIGFEMIGAVYAERHGMQSGVGYEAVATIEEVLEMSGLIVLGYGLARLLALARIRLTGAFNGSVLGGRSGATALDIGA
jgi:hypothetical protein